MGGVIVAAEMLRAFKERGWDQDRAVAVMKALDIDASGALGFNEWVAATMDLDVMNMQGLSGHVRSLFSQLDMDANGTIEFQELRERFGVLSPEQENALLDFFHELILTT